MKSDRRHVSRSVAEARASPRQASTQLCTAAGRQFGTTLEGDTASVWCMDLNIVVPLKNSMMIECCFGKFLKVLYLKVPMGEPRPLAQF